MSDAKPNDVSSDLAAVVAELDALEAQCRRGESCWERYARKLREAAPVLLAAARKGLEVTR
jgi:hypothetical protein